MMIMSGVHILCLRNDGKRQQGGEPICTSWTNGLNACSPNARRGLHYCSCSCSWIDQCQKVPFLLFGLGMSDSTEFR